MLRSILRAGVSCGSHLTCSPLTNSIYPGIVAHAPSNPSGPGPSECSAFGASAGRSPPVLCTGGSEELAATPSVVAAEWRSSLCGLWSHAESRSVQTDSVGFPALAREGVLGQGAPSSPKLRDQGSRSPLVELPPTTALNTAPLATLPRGKTPQLAVVPRRTISHPGHRPCSLDFGPRTETVALLVSSDED